MVDEQAEFQRCYSLKLWQYFKTEDGTVCSPKKNTDGKFDFRMGGVLYVGWFIRKSQGFWKC